MLEGAKRTLTDAFRGQLEQLKPLLDKRDLDRLLGRLNEMAETLPDVVRRPLHHTIQRVDLARASLESLLAEVAKLPPVGSYSREYVDSLDESGRERKSRA